MSTSGFSEKRLQSGVKAPIDSYGWDSIWPPPISHRKEKEKSAFSINMKNSAPDEIMSRRRFIARLATTFKMALAAQFLPRAVRAADQSQTPPLHYRPLNGNNLREMARRKMHHGDGLFLNPMGIAREKRFWQVLSWKLFHPLGYDSEFDSVGMRHRTQLDWYNRYTDGRREITCLPANHWTMRNPIAGPNRSLWGGYLIKTAGGPVIYISGDSAYFDGFEQLADETDIDLAIFNVGAYAPRWFMAPSHMNPEESVRAFREIRARRLMIAHWGTFRLGDEPVHFPPGDIKKVLEEDNLLSHYIPLGLGESDFF
jgi:hypothetical protein